MKLTELKNSETAVIVKVKGRGAFRKRIIEMGFVKGQTITAVKNAPLNDPIEYKIMGYEISLRRSESELIEVISVENAKEIFQKVGNGIFEEFLYQSVKEKGNIINIALVGNPNCGKTTLFNYASGAKEHVGNYSGVTVDAKTASFFLDGYTFQITDLPGTYSLSAFSPEELYVRRYITDYVPDVVINVIDASNLERNLYLTTQLIDMDINMIIALNMYDELIGKGARFDYFSLSKMIGVPICTTVSSKGKGIEKLFRKVIEMYEDKEENVRHIHINYGKETEAAIKSIQSKLRIPENHWLKVKISTRFIAIKLLEKDRDALKLIQNCINYTEIKATTDENIAKLENQFSDDTETIITDAKYGFISGALKETYREGRSRRRKNTEIIDTFLTHKVFGFPIFIFFMWVMFQGTFSIGQYPMDWIERLVDLISSLTERYMTDGMLKDLFVDGIIGGVGGVVVFLPNILILFFFISLMEDTGYMARAAFIMDKIMHKIGLHGKSFIPLIIGFGCNVPAIMATRTLENRSDRLLTILINPLMSCSARLPVYLVLIGAFFPDNPGSMLFLIYAIGVMIASVVAIVFRKTIFKKHEAPFVMELPPYRLPQFRSTLKHMWAKAEQYLRKMGGIILVASILVWALGYFPRTAKTDSHYDSLITQINEKYNSPINRELTDSSKKIIALRKDAEINQLLVEKEALRQEHSWIGRVGKFIEPTIEPLGFDWKMGVSLFSGVAAKEIIVSTMGVLYQANNKETSTLQDKLKNETYKSGEYIGKKVFTPLKAFSFMIFILLYFPCLASIVAINKEAGAWKWGAFTIFYTSAIAWIASFIVYQFGLLIL